MMRDVAACPRISVHNNHKIISYSVFPQDLSNASIIIMLYVRLKTFYKGVLSQNSMLSFLTETTGCCPVIATVTCRNTEYLALLMSVSPLSVDCAQRDGPQVRAEFGKLRNVVGNLKERWGSWERFTLRLLRLRLQRTVNTMDSTQ